MAHKIARVLRLPAGETKDHDGREYAEDWVITDLEKDDDGAWIFLTTNSVHASEYGSFIPQTQHALGVFLAKLINERFEAGSVEDWVNFVWACHEEAEALKVKHARERDKAAGQLDLSGMALKRKRP